MTDPLPSLFDWFFEVIYTKEQNKESKAAIEVWNEPDHKSGKKLQAAGTKIFYNCKIYQFSK